MELGIILLNQTNQQTHYLEVSVIFHSYNFMGQLSSDLVTTESEKERERDSVCVVQVDSSALQLLLLTCGVMHSGHIWSSSRVK